MDFCQKKVKLMVKYSTKENVREKTSDKQQSSREPMFFKKNEKCLKCRKRDRVKGPLCIKCGKNENNINEEELSEQDNEITTGNAPFSAKN